MICKNSDCIIPLVQYLREHSPDTLVSVNIFISATAFEITCSHKSVDDLRIDGISMRNLKGDFITQNEIKLNYDGSVKRSHNEDYVKE